ncbi:MAG: lipopolysaccharide assembly protein LapA domain-containing protein [Cyanobacteria bacterium J06638_28]
MRLFVISALVIAFLAILFALQNTNLVTIQFFIWEYRQSLALVLLGTLAIGIVIGLLVSVPAILRRSHKASRMRKQADSLTTLVEAKESAISTEAQKVEALRQNYGSLLTSLGLIEPVTGLLRHDLLQQAIATHVQHLKTNHAEQLETLSVLLLKVQPHLADGQSLQDIFTATAKILQQRATTNTWFYSDGQGLFAATAPNLDVKTATRYGEMLQTEILEQLPVLAPGTNLEVMVSVGGAIADQQLSIDGHQVVATAEAALDQAMQRGRNRIKITQAA